MAVNPRMSEKRKVMVFFSPPNLSDSLDSASLETISGARYWEKAVLTLLRSNSVKRKLKNVIIK